MRDEIFAAIARATIYPYNKAKYSQYQSKVADAPRIGEERLLELVRRTQDTRFGRDHNFTGIDSPYERPESPEIHLQTLLHTPREAAELVFSKLD